VYTSGKLIGAILGIMLLYFICAFIPDFLSLWKTRFLLGVTDTRKATMLIVGVDAILSATFSLIFYFSMVILLYIFNLS
jgi:hypothetical protein